jgi:hypothetical protein
VSESLRVADYFGCEQGELLPQKVAELRTKREEQIPEKASRVSRTRRMLAEAGYPVKLIGERIAWPLFLE